MTLQNTTLFTHTKEATKARHVQAGLTIPLPCTRELAAEEDRHVATLPKAYKQHMCHLVPAQGPAVSPESDRFNSLCIAKGVVKVLAYYLVK